MKLELFTYMGKVPGLFGGSTDVVFMHPEMIAKLKAAENV